MVSTRPSLTTASQVRDACCTDTNDLKMAKMYQGVVNYQYEIRLNSDYEQINLKEESGLTAAWTNDKTMEMVLIVGEDIRVYEYSDKEMYKTDARILRSKSERIGVTGG